MSNEKNDHRLQAITSLMHQIDHHSSANPIQPSQLESYKPHYFNCQRASIFSRKKTSPPQHQKRSQRPICWLKTQMPVRRCIWLAFFRLGLHRSTTMVRLPSSRAFPVSSRTPSTQERAMSLVRVRQRSRLTAHWSSDPLMHSR